jgi:polyhydroxyalkanoate synthesis regulator phasin
MKAKISTVMLGILMTGIICVNLTSCKTNQKTVSAKDEGEVLISTYCDGPEFQTTNKAFRYSAIGESMDQMTAKKKAMSEARAGLAAAINVKVKSVVDNYVKSGNFNNKEELLKNYEGMNRELVDQSLSGTTVICEKMTKTKEGNYKSYVCIELGSNDILQSIAARASNSEILKVDYNYEKFKKTFEEEMGKTGKE